MVQGVRLTDPFHDEPTPVPGCDVCAALHSQWMQATDVGSPAFDQSHAVDLAVEISRHPHKSTRADK
jgi:hypothetical protein